MNKKTIIKTTFLTINIIVILLFIYSLINYKFLENEIGIAEQTSGIIIVAIFAFILEGAPVFVGPSVAIAALLAAGGDPWILLAIFLISAIMGNIFYYYLGYHLGKKTFKYFEEEDVQKYKNLFKKYGTAAMIIMAISPIPYLPTIAGAFKMSAKNMFLTTMSIRIARHIVVFLFWVIILT